MNQPGWRRHASARQASPEILETLRGLSVSLLSDNMARVSGTVGLVPYHKPKPMAGTAVTVRTRPGDNLAIHRAFDFCRPGDVLVIDGGGDITQALMGEIMATFAESLGVQGLVIDGAIRDVGVIREHDFPVYARAVTHRGPYKNGPGDIIVGDEDGVLAISPEDVATVIEGAKLQANKEAAALRSIAEGRFDREWIGPQEKKMIGSPALARLT